MSTTLYKSDSEYLYFKIQVLIAYNFGIFNDETKVFLKIDNPSPARANSIFCRRKSSFIKQDIKNPIPAHPAVNISAVIAAVFG